MVDMRAFAEPDVAVLETLARLQLTARRFGTSIVLQHASPALVDLLTFAGLSEVLPTVG